MPQEFEHIPIIHVQHLPAIIMLFHLADLGARIGNFVRHTTNHILTRKSDGLAHRAVGGILINPGIAQTDTLKNLILGQRHTDAVDQGSGIVGIQSGLSTLLVKSFHRLKPQRSEPSTELVHTHHRQIMLKKEKGVQMWMPAVDVAVCDLLSADETEFSEVIHQLDKSALLGEVPPDLKELLANRCQIVSLGVAERQSPEDDAVSIFLAGVQCLANLVLALAHDLVVADRAAVDVSTGGETAEARAVLRVIVQAYACAFFRGLAAESAASATKDTPIGLASRPAMRAKTMQLSPLRRGILPIRARGSGGTSR